MISNSEFEIYLEKVQRHRDLPKIGVLEKAVLQGLEESVHLKNYRLDTNILRSSNFGTLFKSSKLNFSTKPKYINITIYNI
jgi:hypothetical protein